MTWVLLLLLLCDPQIFSSALNKIAVNDLWGVFFHVITTTWTFTGFLFICLSVAVVVSCTLQLFSNLLLLSLHLLQLPTFPPFAAPGSVGGSATLQRGKVCGAADNTLQALEWQVWSSSVSSLHETVTLLMLPVLLFFCLQFSIVLLSLRPQRSLEQCQHLN